MKKSFLLALATIALAACTKPEIPKEELPDLAIKFSEKAYVVTLGQTSSIDFTVEGIGGADVVVNATAKKASEWTVSATLDKDGKGKLSVTAPEKLALTTVDIEVVDEKNTRRASTTISLTANAQGLDPLEVAFAGEPYTIKAGGSPLEINYSVSGIGKAVLSKPTKNDVTTTLTVDDITYDEATASGKIIVSCASTFSGESATVKLVVGDSYARTGDKTAQVTVEPAPVVEGAFNCYMVVPGNTVTFPKKATEVTKVELAWQDAPTLIKSMKVEGDNVEIVTDAVEGNALVLGKDEGGTTKWSWHIWVTAYNPATDNITINGITFMTRNLGAVSATPGDAGCCGMTYQWGRKDPLPRMTSIVSSGNATDVIYDASGTEITTKKSSKYYKSKGTAETISIETSYAYPEYFIERYASTGAWWRVETIDVAKNFWGGEDLKKSVNDPCPKGWKVPAVTKNENGDNVNPYAFLLTDKAVIDVDNHGLSYSDGGKTVWFPCTGERYRTSGLSGRNGFEGNYWTATYNSTTEEGIYTFWYAQFTTSDVQPNKSLEYGGIRIVQGGTAIAVRCVKE